MVENRAAVIIGFLNYGPPAVLGIESLCNGICQNPDVRSIVEKIVDSDLQMSPMHICMSFIVYFFPVLLSSHNYPSMVEALPYQGLFLSWPMLQIAATLPQVEFDS